MFRVGAFNDTGDIPNLQAVMWWTWPYINPKPYQVSGRLVAQWAGRLIRGPEPLVETPRSSCC